MRLLWIHHSQEEYWGFLLIHARNAFNEENRTAMLWAVQHEWPRGAQFTVNCYSHWANLVVCNTKGGLGHLLNSKEDVTQGDPLAMIAYGIGVLPLIRELRYAQPRVTQPWYTDDAGAGGNLGTSWNTSRTCRRGGHSGATYQNQPRVSWSWPLGRWQGQRSSSSAWV